jgi:hypothetical protein
LTFSFDTLQSGINVWLCPVLQVSGASLNLTLSAATNTVGGTTGLSGTLSVTGTPTVVGASAITLSGPLTGWYSTLP